MGAYEAALKAQIVSLRARLTMLAEYDGLCYEERREYNLCSAQVEALESELKHVETEDSTEMKAARLESIILDVIGCFEAAEVEGLTQALLNTSDLHLKDLVERRLMYALHAANGL